ncbi:hypothetical protein WN55_06246 [Dufourea novaeangliae]|uniref:Uncharacterized protein n=1 Tax=Dufourea novaeangliae TaxID=178035 RepID=A0A154PQA2_DUFNO|nr:hypothetical protein WN55_06246 [Dufourea novaeangliae]
MEPGTQPVERGVWRPEIVHIPSADDFKTVFCSPLHVVGSNCTALDQFPHGMDRPKAAYSRSVTFTGWNTQSRMLPLAINARDDVSMSLPTEDEEHPQKQFMFRKEAIRYMTSKPGLFSVRDISAVKSGKMHFTCEKYLIKTDTLRKRYGHQYLKIVDGCVESDTLSCASSYERLHIYDDVVHTTSSSKDDLQPDAPVPPSGKNVEKPWSAASVKVPIRAMSMVNTLHQNEAAKQPAWSAVATTLLNRFNVRDVMNSTLAPAVRGMQVREISAVSYVLSTVGNSNASWIDTAPLLKGLLYAYPSSPHAFVLDKVSAQFIRGVSKTDSQSFKLYWTALGASDVSRHVVRVMAATLPAFVDIARGADPYFNDNQNVKYFQTDHMDSTWTAIPITTHMLGVPWLLEYVMMHLPTCAWAGRSNYVWRSLYDHYPTKTFTNKLNVQTSAIPAAHNVMIGGFLNIMLVCVDETSTCNAGFLDLSGAAALRVYVGGRKRAHEVEEVLACISDITTSVMHRTTTEGYRASATNMCAAVDCVGKLLPQDGAMRMAVSLAAELSSVMFVNPYLEVNEMTHQYGNELLGAWTFGGGRLPDGELTTKDAWEGTETERTNRLCSMFHGFNFSSLSPCGFIWPLHT